MTAQPTAASTATLAQTHLKTHHYTTTQDGWRLHLVRTRAVGSEGMSRRYPVVLIPGLGSAGTWTFDLSPAVSLADWLASRGWDVWTVELRGNGGSDKPALFRRSRWWTVDCNVELDAPALLTYVLHTAGAERLHAVGHSMGGMILTRLLAQRSDISRHIVSAVVLGSSVFLKGHTCTDERAHACAGPLRPPKRCSPGLWRRTRRFCFCFFCTPRASRSASAGSREV